MNLRELINAGLLKIGYRLVSMRKELCNRDLDADLRNLFRGRTVETVFDVGAYDGSVAERYLDLFPVARIYSFEPNPDQLALLKQKFPEGSRVKLTAAAVGDREGVATLHLNAFAPTNSILPSVAGIAEQGMASLLVTERKVEVPLVTLDGFCRSHGVSQIDFLKLDVQGAEKTILQGASSLIQARAIGVIQMEINLMPYYEGQAQYYELGAILGASGYRLFNFYDGSVGKNGQLRYCDAFFLSPEMSASLVW